MAQTNPEQLEQLVRTVFEGVQRPSPYDLERIGCCQEHRADFDWYREHTWDQMPAIIDELDPFEFPSVGPETSVYFFPGILLAIIGDCKRAAASGTSPDLTDWALALAPVPTRRQVPERVVALLSDQQRHAVAAVLAALNNLHLGHWDYRDKDIDLAIDRFVPGFLTETQE